MLHARALSSSDADLFKVDRHVRGELVVLLFGNLLPMTIIGVALVLLSAMSAWNAEGWLSPAIPVMAGIVGAYRVTIVVAFRRWTAAERNIGHWELAYSAGLIAFSMLVGAFCFDAFQNHDPMTQMMAITILVGYCAGTAARVFVRPVLAVTAMAIASLPAVAGCLLAMTPEYLGVGGVISVLLLGSLQTLRETYRNLLQHLVMRRRFEELAGLDPLTGLTNRAFFYRKLDMLLAVPKGTVAVHFVDLDNFKTANDTYGHAAGDAVLREVANRLSAASCSGMIVARLGGDEFVVVQPDIAFAEEARLFGKRIVEIVSQPIAWSGSEIRIGASVGCAVAEGATMTAEAAIALADRALYAAKQKGRGGVVMADPTALAA